jgi:hypothetical protein
MSWLSEAIKVYHNSEGVASVYGVIMYTDVHAHVKKVLADEDYWKSLDLASGERWAVFAVRAIQGTSRLPDTPRSNLSFLVPIWEEPTANAQLLDDLELADTKALPSLIVFIFDNNHEVIRSILPIEEESLENAYTSIKRNLQVVAEALAMVSQENLRNAEGLNNAVGGAIGNYKSWKMIKNAFNLVERIKTLMS